MAERTGSVAELRRSLRIVRAMLVAVVIATVIVFVVLTVVGIERAWSLVMIVLAALNSINIVLISIRLNRLGSAEQS